MCTIQKIYTDVKNPKKHYFFFNRYSFKQKKYKTRTGSIWGKFIIDIFSEREDEEQKGDEEQKETLVLFVLFYLFYLKN